MTEPFKIVGTGYDEKMPEGFDPENGTISRAVAVCIVCGASVDAKTTRRLFQEGKAGERMIAVVLHKPGQSGKRYRLVTAKDMEIFIQAEKFLAEKRERLKDKWGMDPVPDEEILPTPSNTMGGTNRILNYRIKTWGDLFNSRQKLALIIFVDKVKEVANSQWAIANREYDKAVVSYLCLSNGKLIDKSSTLCSSCSKSQREKCGKSMSVSDNH